MPIDFRGQSVVSFESGRAAEMMRLIERCSGKGFSAPTMRAVPLETHSEAIEFADRLVEGSIDVVIFLTVLGTRMLAAAAAERLTLAQYTEALGPVVTVPRGPGPAETLHELGLEPSILAPEPYTCQDVLSALDEQYPINGKIVAVQEYGQSNPDLIEGLERRGAEVLPVPIYRWRLPEDLAPVRKAIDLMITGGADFALFTSSTQIRHLFQVAEMDRRAEQLRHGLKTVCIGSVGAVASRAVSDEGVTVDLEPDSPRMSHLVQEMARRGHDLLHKKRTAVKCGVNTNRWKRIDMVWPRPDGRAPEVSAVGESVFIRACRRQPTPYTPIWLMRQAGRYQRAYRMIKTRTSMLELCKSPPLAAELTLMAVEQLGVDAAIIFCDLLPVVETMGMHLRYEKGSGPVLDPPIHTRRDIDCLKDPDIGEMGYLFEALQITRKALRPDVALIGFAGAPFTIASYMIEGGKSSHYIATKTMMHGEPAAWNALMERLTDLLIEYLNAQIDAGADAVQLFDSWVGALCPDDYRQHVMPHVRRLIAGVKKSAPLIHFATGNPALLPLLKQAGGDVIGLDWRVDLADAWAMLGDDVAVMGNLDPAVLHAPPVQIRAAARAILDKVAGRPGHIFNLGHGILPSTHPRHVAELVDAVHEMSGRYAGNGECGRE